MCSPSSPARTIVLILRRRPWAPPPSTAGPGPRRHHGAPAAALGQRRLLGRRRAHPDHLRAALRRRRPARGQPRARRRRRQRQHGPGRRPLRRPGSSRSTTCPPCSSGRRERAAAEGLEVEIVEGDAQALPFPDARVRRGRLGGRRDVRARPGAGRPPRCCASAARAARSPWPTGRPEGFIGELFRTVGAHVPAAGRAARRRRSGAPRTTCASCSGDGVTATSAPGGGRTPSATTPPEQFVDTFRDALRPDRRGLRGARRRGPRRAGGRHRRAGPSLRPQRRRRPRARSRPSTWRSWRPAS